MKELILKNLLLLKTLSDRFKTYQNASVDLRRLIYFIIQFDDITQAEIIIELLSKIDFIDSNKMTYLLQQAYSQIDTRLLHRPLVCPLGSIQDSSALVCNKLIKILFENETSGLNCITELGSIGSELLIEKPSCIIFFDDNITSGTQLVQFFDELIDGADEPEIVKQKLSQEQLDVFRRTAIRLCFAVQLSAGCISKIQEVREKHRIDIQILVGKTDLNNHLDYGSSTFSTFHESERAQKFIMAISEQLYKNKNWSKETLYSRLLGYGNLGKLTVFYHNVPKSLIPIFWKFGSYKQRPWIPLFPENKEAKQIADDNVEMDTYRLDLIDTWLASAGSDRKPKLVFGFLVNNEIVADIDIPIFTQEVFAERYQSHINPTMLRADENRIRARLIEADSPLSQRNLGNSLSPKEYQNYLLAVNNYNESLSSYRKTVEDYIRRYISFGSTEFIVRNEGTKPATNVKVEFFYNTGNIIMRNFQDVPKPKFKETKPSLTDFEVGVARIAIPPFDLFYPSFIEKREPIELNVDYTIKEIWARVGHNDEKKIALEIHRINDTNLEFKINYQVNFDEEPDTISGILTIRFVPQDNWLPTSEFDRKIFKTIDNLFDGLHRGPRIMKM